MQRLARCKVGETVPEQFAARPRSSRTRRSSASTRASRCASRRATTAPASCSSDILVGEEEHADWLETQLHLIEALGEMAYLAEQMHD